MKNHPISLYYAALSVLLALALFFGSCTDSNKLTEAAAQKLLEKKFNRPVIKVFPVKNIETRRDQGDHAEQIEDIFNKDNIYTYFKAKGVIEVEMCGDYPGLKYWRINLTEPFQKYITSSYKGMGSCKRDYYFVNIGNNRLQAIAAVKTLSAREAVIEYTMEKQFNKLGKLLHDARTKFNESYLCPDKTETNSIKAILTDDGWKLSRKR